MTSGDTSDTEVYRCGGCECVFAERAAYESDEDRCPFCGTPTNYEKTEVRTVEF